MSIDMRHLENGTLQDSNTSKFTLFYNENIVFDKFYTNKYTNNYFSIIMPKLFYFPEIDIFANSGLLASKMDSGNSTLRPF